MWNAHWEAPVQELHIILIHHLTVLNKQQHTFSSKTFPTCFWCTLKMLVPMPSINHISCVEGLATRLSIYHWLWYWTWYIEHTLYTSSTVFSSVANMYGRKSWVNNYIPICCTHMVTCIHRVISYVSCNLWVPIHHSTWLHVCALSAFWCTIYLTLYLSWILSRWTSCVSYLFSWRWCHLIWYIISEAILYVRLAKYKQNTHPHTNTHT